MANLHVKDKSEQGSSESEAEFVSDNEMEYNSASESAEDDKVDKATDQLAKSIGKILTRQLDSRINKMENLVKGSVAKQNQKIDQLSDSFGKLEEKLSQVQKERDFLLKLINEKNIIIHGVEDKEIDEEKLTAQVEQIFLEATKISIKTDDVYRIGKYKDDQCRPICAVLFSRRDKKKVIQCKNNFKKLATPCSVSSDIPKSIRFGHKLLFEKKQELEKNGSTGTICFKTNCITSTNGDIFEVRDGKICNKDETRRKRFKRPRRTPQNEVIDDDQDKGTASKKSKADKSPRKTPSTSDYSFRTSTTSQRGNGAPSNGKTGKGKGNTGTAD